MKECPICGAETPSMERIIPLALQCFPPGTPRLALFLCHGATRVDPGFLRFGIIDLIPWSCRNTRWIPWEEMTYGLRKRANLAEQLRMSLGGMI
jgi:hypothetical protein